MNTFRIASFKSLIPILVCMFIVSCKQSEPATVIKNVTLIRGDITEPFQNQTIVLQHGIITEVGPSNEIPIPENAKVIDGTGLFAIPGLWDAHVHLSKIKEDALPVFVANGVTAVRDMGSVYREVKEMETKIREDKLIGPIIITSGPLLEAPETIERIKSQETLEDYENLRIPVPDSSSAFAIVDSLKEMGVDFIKVREYASISAYKGIAEAAKQVDLGFVGHPPYGMDPIEAANTLGMQTWEHASYPYPLPEDQNELDNLLHAIKSNDIAVVPTLATWQLYVHHPDSVRKFVNDTLGQYDPRRVLISTFHATELSLELKDKEPKTPGNLRGWKGFINQTARDMKTFQEAGINILPGSDQTSSELIPGYSLHKEMELLQNMAGLTPAEILKSATYTSSKVFNMEDSLGTIQEGKIANIILLQKNPLEDITNTRAIKYVINRGDVIDEKQISNLLKGLTPATRSNIEYIQQ